MALKFEPLTVIIGGLAVGGLPSLVAYAGVTHQALATLGAVGALMVTLGAVWWLFKKK